MKIIHAIVMSVLVVLAFGTVSTVNGQDLTTDAPLVSVNEDEGSSNKKLAKACVKKAKTLLQEIQEDQKMYLQLQQLYDRKKSLPKNHYLSTVLGMGWELNHAYGIDITKLIVTHAMLKEGRHTRKLGEILDQIYMERNENMRLMSSLEKFTTPIPDIYKN